VVGLGFDIKDVLEGVGWLEIPFASDETGAVVLDGTNHFSLAFDRLRTIDETKTALSGECYCHLGAGDGLHAGRDEWDVGGEFGLLADFVFGERGSE